MNRQEKIDRLKELNNIIKEKTSQIKQATDELNLLKKEYERENVSELPILLFLIDESLPMPDDEHDMRYEYVYYCPDLDAVTFRYLYKYNDLLPNTVDLTENFKDIGMPKRIYPGSAQTCSEYGPIIEYAEDVLKKQIDAIFASEKIASWADLAKYLTEGIPEKVQPIKLQLGCQKSSEN